MSVHLVKLLLLLAVLTCVHSTILTYSSRNGVVVGLGRCANDEYECPSGLCINQTSVCDGVGDCLGREDELFCPLNQNCRIDEYRCPGGSRCFPLYTLCDGVDDCTNGTDEVCPTPPDSMLCGFSEFLCDGDCIASAYLCDGVQNCADGGDESQCGEPSVQSVSRNVSVSKGDRITLTCRGNGYPPPFVSWKKNNEPIAADPRYELVSTLGIGTLTIDNAQGGDSGVYRCELQSKLYGSILSEETTFVSVNDSNPPVCEDHRNQAYMQGDFYYTVRSFASGPASQAAADIIFVVDESGSMSMEHAWIQREVYLLDQALRERGVGIGMRQNLFGLVGFGRNDPTSIGGITLSQLAPPDDFVAAAKDLQLTGVLEDGYSGIDHALSTIQTRAGTAKQLILVTDEDRGVLRVDLSRAAIAERVKMAGFMLNVILNQGFLSDPLEDRSFALGLGTNSTAYVVDTDSASLFSAVDGGAPNLSPFFGFGDSFEEYGLLAHSTGGAAWDLNQLREQGILAEAFTNAFTAVKVEEVMSVLRDCLLCRCQFPQERCSEESNRTIEQCSGLADIITVNVVPGVTLAAPGNRVVFECVANANLLNTDISISWEYPSGSQVAIRDRFLSVDVTAESEGVYTCIGTTNSTGSVRQTSGSASLQLDTRCVLDDGTYLVLGESRNVLSSQNTNQTKAADIILLVDESGSMTMEHAWIPEMIQELDERLQSVGVGVSPRNRFGIVGFGDDCSDETTLARVFTSPTDQFFVTSDNISDFTMNLSVGGRKEDGYSAITAAIESYEFRDVAKQFILITDEDRDVLDVNITRTVLQQLLTEEGIVLNVVVSEEYSGDEMRGLGIDNQANAYVYDPSARSLFRVVPGSGMPIQDSAHGTTNSDYSQLALEVNGAAWDISQLRRGGRVADAFTQAFVSVKVLEVRAQMEECLECLCMTDGPSCEAPSSNTNVSCPSVAVPALPGETPLEIELNYTTTVTSPGQDLTIYCRVNCTATLNWSFNGGSLPSNAQITEITGFMTRLTVVDGDRDSAGVYACFAQSASETYSGVVSVRVEFYDPEQDIMLELEPLEANFPRGGDSELLCSVESPAVIEWRFNDGPLPVNTLVTDSLTFSSLTIMGTMDSNSGAYTCSANNTDRGVINEDTAYVQVVDPAIRLTVEPDTFEVEINSSVELVCEVSSDFPDVMVEWNRVGDQPLPPQAEVRKTADNVVLLIANVSVDDGGRYVCAAQAEGQFTERAAYITVQDIEAPFEVMLDPSLATTVDVGTNVSVLCEVNQNATGFTWYFNSTVVQVQGEPPLEGDVAPLNVVAVNVSVRRSVLSVLMASEGNTGVYECVALSADGDADRKTIVVTVR